jgi:sarcosine oxidase subunit beta
MTGIDYDLAIIGAGILGLSTAYFVNEASDREIIIIDRAGSVGQGTTGHSTGGIRHTFTDPVLRTLTRESLPFYRSFDENFDERSGFSQHGYLFLTEEESTARDLKDQCETLCDHGFRAEWIYSDQIADEFPVIRSGDLLGGLLGPDDGSADPWQVAQGLYRSLKRQQNVEFRFNQPVESVKKVYSGYRITGNNTVDIAPSEVVNAAGPLLTAIESPFDRRIPLQAHNRQVCVLSSPEGVQLSPPIPLIVDKETGFYFHPLNEHEVLAGGTDKGKHRTSQPEVDRETTVQIIEAGCKRIEHFNDYKLVDSYASLRGYVPDYRGFVDDLSDKDEGYYVLGGFTGHGFMHAPAIGKITRDLILQGETDLINSESLSLERFENTELEVEENTF